MVVIPNSDIILLKTPFEIDEANTLTFANATAQYNYFISLPKLELENATYQRKDGVLRWSGKYDDILEYNYCMYRNTSYNTKWFYAFIEDIKYVNDGMTELKLKTDVFQSWQFEIGYKRMFVEREHVSDDTVGKHTIPENLETGEYVSNKEKTSIPFGLSSCIVVMAVSDLPADNLTFTKGKYNGIYSGLYYLAFRNATTGAVGIPDLNKVIRMYALGGRLQAIQSIFYAYLGVSMDVAEWTFTQGGTTITADVGVIPNSDNVYVPTNSPITITKPITLSGSYSPKNNKLFTYPYMYFNVSNHSGISVPFRYEDFSSSVQFKIYTAITVGGSIKIVPLNYKGVAENYENSINAGKFPVCSWTGDVYLNWLTQQSVNINLGLLSAGGGLLTSIATGGVYGGEALLSGIDKIGSFLEQQEKQKLVPDQVEGNINSGDINFSSENNGYAIYYMSIKKEYAEIIDNFFSAYGYKVLSYKIPNVYGRTNWNYVKTGECNIIGNIPQNDLQEIKKLFMKGITFWHNPSTFLDYSQSNTIVT